MQFLLSLLWFAILVGASYNAKLTEESVAIDTLDLVPHSGFPAERVPENQCLSSFYHTDAAKNMCGESTFANNLNYQCEHGTASLGDDCNALIQDLLAKGGGGFWGYTDESDVVIASHESCTFRITVQDSKDLFNIGVQDVIDLGKSIESVSMFPCPLPTPYKRRVSSVHYNTLKPSSMVA